MEPTRVDGVRFGNGRRVADLLDDVVSFFKSHLLELLEVVDGLGLARALQQRLRGPRLENGLGFLQIFLHLLDNCLDLVGRRHRLVDVQVDVVALPVQGLLLGLLFLLFWSLFVG